MVPILLGMALLLVLVVGLQLGRQLLLYVYDAAGHLEECKIDIFGMKVQVTNTVVELSLAFL
ncbi:hypothetical protein PHMEG_00024592 [Phytophthora megakarya]|uniref:Uncharacterized protein n=1 Tax=Phytophthora megakarya TaxID=4795 RepID=A0A225VFJ8_9STRA|nr:hypothetical protein PHMEG_00024592 [Phytophthora megakarya]